MRAALRALVYTATSSSLPSKGSVVVVRAPTLKLPGDAGYAAAIVFEPRLTPSMNSSAVLAVSLKTSAQWNQVTVGHTPAQVMLPAPESAQNPMSDVPLLQRRSGLFVPPLPPIRVSALVFVSR